MSRALVVIAGQAERAKARRWIDIAPVNTRVTFQAPKRSLPQNSRFWLMLTELAEQLTWHGMKLSPDDWRLVMLDALKREQRIVPNIDGNGFVNLGRSSSDLSKAEFSDLFEVMEAFAAREGVTFSEPERDGAQPQRRQTDNSVNGLNNKILSSTGTGVAVVAAPEGGE
jgi:hypothetical protein